MIKVFVNGDSVSVNDLPLDKLLEKIKLVSKDGIAIAVNETVIPRSTWNDYQLREGDHVIIITATQGG